MILILLHYCHNRVHTWIYFPLDAVAYTNAFYGQGAGLVLLDDVSCTGTESRLVGCPYDSNTVDCSHSEDAGVHCNNTCKQKQAYTNNMA